MPGESIKIALKLNMFLTFAFRIRHTREYFEALIYLVSIKEIQSAALVRTGKNLISSTPKDL